jgi:hypothetical protein
MNTPQPWSNSIVYASKSADHSIGEMVFTQRGKFYDIAVADSDLHNVYKNGLAALAIDADTYGLYLKNDHFEGVMAYAPGFSWSVVFDGVVCSSRSGVVTGVAYFRSPSCD